MPVRFGEEIQEVPWGKRVGKDAKEVKEVQKVPDKK